MSPVELAPWVVEPLFTLTVALGVVGILAGLLWLYHDA